jgi:hypothetical protein
MAGTASPVITEQASLQWHIAATVPMMSTEDVTVTLLATERITVRLIALFRTGIPR